MRKVVASIFVTLDGVVQDPGGADGFELGGWSFKYSGRSEEELTHARRPAAGQRCPAAWAGDLRGLRQGMAFDDRRRLVRGQDERAAEVCRLIHARQGR